MRRFIFLAFIGLLFVKNATPSKNQRYPSHLEWLFGLNNKQNENKEKDKLTVCQSQECKKIARIISESMNKAVDPCDDFYEYACGKWSEHNAIPKGKDSWSMFESAQINVARQIKEIFDEGPKDDDLLAVKLAKKWYSVCMDTDAMEKQGLEPLVLTLSRIGGWPLIMEQDEWNEQEYSWQKVDDQYVRLIGRNAFHDVRVDEYGSNETRKVVHIDTPHLPPGSYRLWTEIDSEEEKDESDEDPSDEEKQNDDKDSQEPGSEDKNVDKSDDNNDDNNNVDEDDNNDEDDSNDDDEDDSNDDYEDDNNDDDDEDDDCSNDEDSDKDDDNDEDDDSDTNEQNNDDEAKKKVGMKKTGKLTKKKKLGHSKKVKSSTHSKKYKNHKTKKERIKKRAISTNVHDKLRVRKSKRNHLKQERMERLKKTLEETTPQISTEETIDKDDKMKQYANHISKVARAIAKARGIKVSEEHINKDIQDMIEFQIKLVELTVMDSIDDEKMTLNDFQEWYDKKESKTLNSAINWVYKIGELFDEAHVPISDDLDLEIGSPDYFKSLVALLDKTSSRTIVNYIHWNFLSRIIRTTTSEMRKLYNIWKEEKKDDDEEVLGVSPRAIRCAFEIKMSDILAYEYVKNHFSDEIMTTASDMMDDIQKEVEYQIKESDWMDEDTKDFILAKLVHMDKFIGYPDWYRNNTIVKRYFQGFVLCNSYYENTLSYERYSKWKRLRELLEEDEDDDITISPVIVNAFFSSDDNFVAFSAADFQSPLFAYGRPQVINYGIVGSIMGHEVNHGFDDSGHLYDKNGDVVEWLSAMAEAYGKRAECFVEQFNNYAVDKTSNYKITNYGNQTIGENIADTMGLEAAFRAYRRRERECGKPNIALPGHEDITTDQLFFLSFANLWCEAADTTNVTISDAKYDVHSTGRLRVIGSVSNSEDFAKAYNCPADSAMNPEKKCHIWK